MTPPTQPTISDERLDRLIRQLLAERAEDVAAAAVSADEMAERIAGRLRPSLVGRAWVLLAAATILATLLIGGALAAGGAMRLPWLQLPAPTPDAAPPPALSTPEGAPSLPPAPSMPDGEVVHGWPDTSENGPGVYSWDGSGGDMFHLEGFMHNGYGSGDVEIRIDVVRDDAIAGGGTPVMVAGHEGTYRRLDAGHEEWMIDIEGTTIAIRLMTRPGTSQADLADAYAIIGSMRTEAHDNPRGFRLLFTLTTDDWDSG